MTANDTLYHVPVLLQESIEGLALKEGGIYVDLTFGGGGHTKEILKRGYNITLIAFDQDLDAAEQAKSINSNSFIFIQANFRFLKRFLKANGIAKVDGILGDLGVSSHQINAEERGFSTRFNGNLDMRMNINLKRSAQDVVNDFSEKELHQILGTYGEVRNAKTLATAIVKSRTNERIVTIDQLKKAVLPFAPSRSENKYLAQVFQALRIEVNEELQALKEMLLQTAEVIKVGGRLVVISYHSLEDRLVKNYINKGLFSGEVDKDVYGNFSTPFRAVAKKPIEAGETEVKRNPRSRSAKLRIAEKL